MFLALALMLVACAAPKLAAQDRQKTAAQAPGEAVYAYTDERGRLIYAHRYSDVPEALRPYARRVDQQAPKPSESPLESLIQWVQGDLPPPAAGPAAASSMYRYRTRQGRVVYTNLADSVPTDQEHTATLDLSHVSINSQLGAEIDQELKTQYDLLQVGPFCSNMRTELNQPLWERVWTAHKPLVVCGAAILALLFVTPWIVRRVGGAAWARALQFAIPALAFLGVSTLLLMRAGSAMSALRGRAQPCDANSWQRASQSQQPLIQHQQLVNALQTETAELERIHLESQL